MMVLVNSPERSLSGDLSSRFSPKPLKMIHPVERKEQYPSVYLWDKGSFVDVYA
jgi:hypothetical protein